MKKLLMVFSGLCISCLLASCSTVSTDTKGAGSLEEITKIALTGNGSLRAQYTDWSTFPSSEASAMKKEMLKFMGPLPPYAKTSIMTIDEYEAMQAKENIWTKWIWNIRPQKVILIKHRLAETGILEIQYGVFEKEGKWYFSKGTLKMESEPAAGGDGKSAPQP